MVDQSIDSNLENKMQAVFSELDADLQRYLINLAQTAHFAEQATKMKYEQPKQTA